MIRNAWLRRMAAVVVAAALAATPAAVAAPAAKDALILTGSGSGWTDLVLPRPVEVAPLLQGARNSAGWTSSGCGRMRGFYLQPLTGDPARGVGAVDLSDLRFGAATDVALPGAAPLPRVPVPLGTQMLDSGNGSGPSEQHTVKVPAGRYRAYLLAETRCSVSVPLKGRVGTVRRSVTNTARAQFAVKNIGPVEQAVPGARLGEVSFPVNVSSTTLAFSLVHVVQYAHAVGPSGVTGYQMCIEPDSAPLCAHTADTDLPGRTAPSRSGFYHHTVMSPPSTLAPPFGAPTGSADVPVSATATQLATWYAPGWLTSGELTAKSFALSVPATAVQGAMFALDLKER